MKVMYQIKDLYSITGMKMNEQCIDNILASKSVISNLFC